MDQPHREPPKVCEYCSDRKYIYSMHCEGCIARMKKRQEELAMRIAANRGHSNTDTGKPKA